MRVTLVHNPDAGDHHHPTRELLRELSDAGYEPLPWAAGKKGIAKALEEPGDLVVVAGGDGSIKKAAVALAGRGVPMALLPIGTANNIAKSLGVMGAVPELIAGWSYPRRKRLTVGAVTAPFGTMRFVESAGVGVFTELIARGETEVDQNVGRLTGHAIDRALLLLQRILEDLAPTPRRLVIDGEDVSGEYLVVEAMNIPLVGPNVPLAPEADFGDDQIDVVTVTGAERELLAGYLEGRLAGGAAPPKLTVRRGRRVTMHASARELHVDDDLWKPEKPEPKRAPRRGREEGEVTVAVAEGAVEVLVPE